MERFTFFAAVFAISILSKSFSASAASCPLYGPVFPIPTNLANSSIFQNAIQNLTAEIKAALASGNSTYGPVDPAPAYTLQIFNLESSKPLLELYHSGTILSNSSGVQKVDGDSVFRIGSISKLVTVYAFLATVGDSVWNDLLPKWLPELRGTNIPRKAHQDPIAYINWADITLGDLAGHTAGVPRDFVDENLLHLNPSNINPSLGLPPWIPESEYPKCIITANNTGCNRTEFFAAIKEDGHPIFLPNTKPIYSNTAFTILAFALESMVQRPFREILESVLFAPLKLNGTFYSKPVDSRGAIPLNSSISGWDAALGNSTAPGGIYSSTNDLSSIGRSILRSVLLPANTTRAWLKPFSPTSSGTFLVGRPWEIFRAEDIGSRNRIVDIFSKGGAIGLYRTRLALVPDYNIGWATAVAGPGDHEWMENMLVASVFPALEEVARQKADETYSGTYTARNGLNSTIALTTNPEFPGLGIRSWISNGTDMFSVLETLGYPITEDAIRLFPMNLEHRESNGTIVVAWRLSLVRGPQGPGVFNEACGSWGSIDGLSLGNWGLDEFVFTLDGRTGRARRVELKGFRAVLEREG